MKSPVKSKQTVHVPYFWVCQHICAEDRRKCYACCEFLCVWKQIAIFKAWSWIWLLNEWLVTEYVGAIFSNSKQRKYGKGREDNTQIYEVIVRSQRNYNHSEKYSKPHLFWEGGCETVEWPKLSYFFIANFGSFDL